MGLISPGGENLLDFLELLQVLSTYDGDLRDQVCCLRKGQSPCELLGGLSGFLSRRFRVVRSCVEWVPVPEDSSPVLTWIWGYFCSLPRGVSPRLEWWHARALSSRAAAGVSHFPSRGSRDQGLSLEAFPRGFHEAFHEAFTRGFPTGLSHVPPWCESILGLKVDAVKGNQVSLEWTETSAGLWEWWDDPGVLLAIPVESASFEMRWECREFFPNHAGKGSLLSS